MTRIALFLLGLTALAAVLVATPVSLLTRLRPARMWPRHPKPQSRRKRR